MYLCKLINIRKAHHRQRDTLWCAHESSSGISCEFQEDVLRFSEYCLLQLCGVCVFESKGVHSLSKVWPKPKIDWGKVWGPGWPLHVSASTNPTTTQVGIQNATSLKTVVRRSIVLLVEHASSDTSGEVRNHFLVKKFTVPLGVHCCASYIE